MTSGHSWFKDENVFQSVYKTQIDIQNYGSKQVLFSIGPGNAKMGARRSYSHFYSTKKTKASHKGREPRRLREAQLESVALTTGPPPELKRCLS